MSAVPLRVDVGSGDGALSTPDVRAVASVQRKPRLLVLVHGDEGLNADMNPHPVAGGAIPAVDPAQAELARRHERDEGLCALLERAATGDSKAFESFYDITVGCAQAIARRMLAGSDIEDILSDAYFQAWREVRRFDPTRGGPVTWLLTIVRSRALDLLRHRRCSPEVEAADGAPDTEYNAPGPEALLQHAQSGHRLHAALLSLAPNERWVLGLAYYRDMPHAAIAQATGMPLGTVKSLILRAQHKLREQLVC